MNFANRTIWTADNMEILPGIDTASVDLVYLDPPFNSNRNYAAPVGSKAAGAALRSLGPMLSQYAGGMGRWLAALDFHLGQPKEIALIGDLNSDAAQDLLEEVYFRYLPNRVLAASELGDSAGSHPLPLLRHKTLVNGQPAAYVCRNYVCQIPITTPTTLATQLDSPSQLGKG